MIPVIGLGAGGHTKVVIDILHCMGTYNIVGLLDPRQELWNTHVSGIPVHGDDQLLQTFYNQGIQTAFIGLGSAGNMHPRRNLYEKVLQYGFHIVEAMHPQAIIASSARIGYGLTIMAGAIINADAHIGNNVIINTGAIVEHDCDIGNHVHIATGARLASGIQVGDGTHIGIGASIRQCIRIGQNVVVGAGAVVVNDIPDDIVVVGVPARPLKKRAYP